MIGGRDGLLSGLRRRSLAGNTVAGTVPVSQPIATNEDLDILQDTAAPDNSWEDMLKEYENSLSSFTSGNYDIRAEEGRGYNGSTSLYNQKYGGDDALESYVGTNSDQFLKGSDSNWTVDLKGASPETVFAGLRKDPRYTALTQYGTFKEQPDGSYRFVKDELSTLQKAAKIAEVATVAGVTGGVGSALGAGLGISSAAGKGLASGLLSAAQGGDIGDMAKNMALSYAGGALGDRIAAGTEFGINPFGEQAGMLADQVSGMGDVYGFLPTALGETSSRLVQGDNLEKAALGGLVAGAKNIDLGDSDFSLDLQTPEFLKEFDKAVIQPAGEALSEFDKSVLQPVTKPIAAGAQYIDDEFIDPTVAAFKEAMDPLQEAGSAAYEVAKDVGKAIDDTIIDPIDAAIREIDLPDIDWPDLPDINWASLFSGGLGAMQLLDGFMGGIGGGGGSITDEFLEGRALKHRLNTDVTVFDKVDINQFNRTT